MSIKTYRDIVDIKQEIYSLPNYPKYVMDAFKYKDYDFIKVTNNKGDESIFSKAN